MHVITHKSMGNLCTIINTLMDSKQKVHTTITYMIFVLHISWCCNYSLNKLSLQHQAMYSTKILVRLTTKTHQRLPTLWLVGSSHNEQWCGKHFHVTMSSCDLWFRWYDSSLIFANAFTTPIHIYIHWLSINLYKMFHRYSPRLRYFH